MICGLMKRALIRRDYLFDRIRCDFFSGFLEPYTVGYAGMVWLRIVAFCGRLWWFLFNCFFC
jgi:hypothetical protein